LSTKVRRISDGTRTFFILCVPDCFPAGGHLRRRWPGWRREIGHVVVLRRSAAMIREPNAADVYVSHVCPARHLWIARHVTSEGRSSRHMVLGPWRGTSKVAELCPTTTVKASRTLRSVSCLVPERRRRLYLPQHDMRMRRHSCTARSSSHPRTPRLGDVFYRKHCTIAHRARRWQLQI
jgi:hypothetical protein